MIQSHSYLTLDPSLYTIMLNPSTVTPSWVVFNNAFATHLGLADLHSENGLQLLAGTKQNHTYFAQAYAGHQFGNFTMLGDGRALNVGEVSQNNKTYDIQLKGSGVTPYSRGGDGKATLYSMLREYIISESLHYLNIPTTRTLSIIQTNEAIQRKKVHKSAIATRVAASHIRVGTFEYARRTKGIALVKELADYTIKRHYPEVKQDYYRLFHQVIKAQAKLIAHWQSVGFIHGVLNTDNVLLSGESIDFGPCAFMDTYDPDTVYSSIDHFGRYRFKNQPHITSWNLSKLAEVLLPLFDTSEKLSIQKANELLSSFEDIYFYYYYSIMQKKLGLKKPNKELINEFLAILKANKLDYTNTFKSLTKNDISSLEKIEAFSSWYFKWKTNRAPDYESVMKHHNPVIIPRNHIVEEALETAAFQNDFTVLNTLLSYVKHPFDYSVKIPEKFEIPNPNNDTYVTYCGT